VLDVIKVHSPFARRTLWVLASCARQCANPTFVEMADGVIKLLLVRNHIAG